MTTPDDFDTPWKEILEGYLPDFLAFFFPAVHAAVDWSRGYTFLDKELQQITRDAALGRRLADKLVQVWRLDGTSAWVLIHIEIQGQEQAIFPERMYVYNYRLFDRYRRPIVSLALLTDEQPAWRPGSFGYQLWGCEVYFQFPIAKVLDYVADPAALAANDNPFATIVLVHQAAQATRKDEQARARLKFQLTRRLYERRMSRQAIIDLYRFIDWLLALPPEIDAAVWHQIKTYEETQKMPYITTAERVGIQQGLAQGRLEAARNITFRQATKRFGALDEATVARINGLPTDQLDDLALAILDFVNVDDLHAWLDALPA
ncbi:MAG: DUF4351 domain-containing protein [Chloroflexaceae bacterium]|jgi:hypothetical protein|nr:DUF4351 domain-containing protein [Chloroflexaceae bacterium]